MTKCKRCKREIRNAISVVHGYGPVCWKRSLKEASIPVEIEKQPCNINECCTHEVCVIQ
jgi:hypothetical protein